MSEIIYATSSGYYDLTKGAFYSSATKAQKDTFRAVYTMATLTKYANAKRMVFHVYVSRGAASTTLTVMAGGSNTSYDSGTAVSKKLTSGISSFTEITFDLSAHISAITAFALPRMHIISDLASEATFFAAAASELYKPYLEIEMSSGGLVYYCLDGVWKPCEAYFATGGKWVQCEARYGYQGAWKELGE